MKRLALAGIALRLWTWAAVLRPLKHVLPLGRLVRLAHTRPRHRRSAEFERRLEAYLSAAGRFPRRPPGNCLERSLGAYRILCAAGAAPSLVIGFRRTPSDDVLGHVWVVVDGRALAEEVESVAGYTPILTFDPDARQRPAGGTSPALSGIRFA